MESVSRVQKEKEYQRLRHGQTPSEPNSEISLSRPSPVPGFSLGSLSRSGSKRPRLMSQGDTETREDGHPQHDETEHNRNDDRNDKDDQSGQFEGGSRSKRSEEDVGSNLEHSEEHERYREDELSRADEDTESEKSGSRDEEHGPNRLPEKNGAINRDNTPIERSRLFQERRKGAGENGSSTLSGSILLPHYDRQSSVEATQGPSEQVRKFKRAKRHALPDTHARQGYLEALGTKWLKFYQDHSSSTDVFSILALVSAVACPEVLLNIATMRRIASTSICPESGETNVGLAYRLHTHASSTILGGHFQKCQSEVLIHNRFVELTEQFRKRIKADRKLRYQREYQKSSSVPGPPRKGKASQYALDLLVQECLQNQVGETTRFRRQRAKVQNIKERGKSLMAFKLEYKEEAIYLWPLFPMMVVQCPLFHGKTADIQE